MTGGKVVFGLALLAAGCGCVTSIEPVIPESEAFFEPRLLGAWKLDDENSTGVVSRAEDGDYLIEFTDDEGRIGSFEGRLGRLEGHLLLEIRPAPAALDSLRVSDSYKLLLIPRHLAVVLDMASDAIEVALLDADSVYAGLDDDRFGGHGHSSWLDLDAAYHEIVLTGVTPEVRTTIAHSLTFPGWLAEPAIWRRVER